MKVEIKDKDKNPYYKMDPEKFEQLISIVENHRYYSKLLNKNKNLLVFLLTQTRFLDVQNPTIRGRLHCIFNGICSLKICEQCNKNLVNLSDCRISGPTKKFCSNSCKASNKEVQLKTQETMLQRHGVRFALQDKDTLNGAIEKTERTNIERYGAKSIMQTEEGKRRQRESLNEKYGVDHNFQIPAVREKIKDTWEEKYGFDHPMRNKEIYKKSRDTCVERYGVEYPIQLDCFKDKLKETNVKKYGTEWNIVSENNVKKSKKTSIEKYGVEYPMQSDVVRQRYKNTLEERYGVEHNMQIHDVRVKQQQKYHAVIFEKYGTLWPIQSPEIQKKARSRYQYKEIRFDSAPEIALYIYLVDHKIEFEYQPNVSFEYQYDGAQHVYFPDFLIENKVYEIKGDHLIEDGKWICPWDRSMDEAYEAKHQCAIQNGVQILTTKDYQKFLDYVDIKYGKNYLMQFKNL